MAELFETGRGEQATGSAGGYAVVAIERGLDTAGAGGGAAGGLTYAVPDSLSDLSVGDRVVVPLGRGDKPVSGYVVERSDTSAFTGGRVKRILERDAGGVSLPPDLIDLARWISGYYCCPLGMVFGSMMPAAVKRGTGRVRRQVVRATEVKIPDTLKLSKLQREVMKIAAKKREAASGGDGGWVDVKVLADLAGAKTVGPVKQLIEKGLLESGQQSRVESDLDLRAQQEPEPPGRVTLNKGQYDAVEHLTEHLTEGFGVHLLHGVTGSGKTEVYLRLIEAALGSGLGPGVWGLARQKTPSPELRPDPEPQTPDPPPPGAIVLVPEIALTPQTVGRFLSRFDSVAVLHSGLTPAQRHAQWRRVRDGEARIVVGARSAVFAPLANLRLVIVDEEHESSYKQDQLPRYHARDVAIKRAQALGIPVVLGSATPSLESYFNAVGRGAGVLGLGSGKKEDSKSETPARPQTLDPRPCYHLIRLPDRVPGMRLPDVQIVDMQDERRHRRGIHLMSRRLEQELERVLQGGAPGGASGDTSGGASGGVSGGVSGGGGASGGGGGRGQAMLLLNRRGYANYIACPDHRCGWMMRCAHCDTTVVYHKDTRLPTGGYVRCHHCDAEQMLVTTCPDSGHKVTVFGLGTQKVEEELIQKFPGIKVARMDSDTMRSARDYQHTLDRFRAGQIDVLLGTQMIAKGLDFPGVRLVGVISADTALHLPDFRASERTFQLISQVAGRSGRSEHLGKVVVQTFSPDDPAIVLAAQHDYETFAHREIALRADVGLPPVTRMARIVIRDRDHMACYENAKTLARHLEAANRELSTGIRMRGPMPCPIARIADHHRQQIELIAAPPNAAGKLQKLMTALRNSKLLISDARTAVDVDPVALL
jgi:primosomal protein N' (replication factor Y) (superfamily II helicase)